MRAIQKKLHSKSGASILMALLLLLVGLMVSAVVISAAVSAATSIRTDRTQQQTYLTVSSAAELMRDSMEEGRCNFTRTVNALYKTQEMLELIGTPTVTDTHETGPFSLLMFETLQRMLNSGATQLPSSVYTVSAEDFDPVQMEVLLRREDDVSGNPVYRLTVWFTGGEAPNQYRMCLTANGVEIPGTPSGAWDGTQGYRVITETKINWKDIKIQRKEAGE